MITLEQALTHKATIGVIAFLGGSLITIIGQYFAFSRDMGQSLSFIRGQNSLLLDRFKLLDKVVEKMVSIDKDVDKAKADINSAWQAIRTLNGGSNHGSSFEDAK